MRNDNTEKIYGYKVMLKYKNGAYATPNRLTHVKILNEEVEFDYDICLLKELKIAKDDLKWKKDLITPNVSSPESGYYGLSPENIIILKAIVPKWHKYESGIRCEKDACYFAKSVIFVEEIKDTVI